MYSFNFTIAEEEKKERESHQCVTVSSTLQKRNKNNLLISYLYLF